MWQPIETAPEDDSVSILASSTGKVWFQATWDADFERWVTFNHYLENDRRQPGDGVFRPKYWVPLPEPNEC